MEIHDDPDKVHFGKNVTSDPSGLFFVTSSGEIWIGDEVVLGYCVKFLCGGHDYTLKEGRATPTTTPTDIKIGKGVWIASFAIICGPCTIGEYAVIGAGSVVTGDVPAGELWAGNPARFIKKIKFKQPA